MSNSIRKQQPPSKSKGACAPQQTSNPKSHWQPNPSASNNGRHAALKSPPKVALSAGRWQNVNRAIEKTVEIVLSKNLALDSFGPDCWEMDEGYGVALVAEIRREIKETCSLDNLKLQKRLRELAHDVTQKEFRFPFRGGGVWFWFKVTDLHKATQPMPENLRAGTQTEHDVVLQKMDEEADSTAIEDDFSQQRKTSIVEEISSRLPLNSY
ncbi:hypothetical protein Daesc_006689 [Daldinia eschscholtzii]|uniref:Uncharacterized protein n=1 Tax=Daldinia eschscholtzii TaxID=292717 RepID=A0AAX6MIB3_9PEZI